LIKRASGKVRERGCQAVLKSRHPLETQRAWLSLPPEERAHIYDAFDDARRRLSAPIETTATVTLGPDNRNVDDADDDQ
jgi:hypothetical protein